jgi:hypothetical protein
MAEFKGYSVGHICLFIDFLYASHFTEDLDVESVKALVSMGEQYLVPAVKSRAEFFLKTHIDPKSQNRKIEPKKVGRFRAVGSRPQDKWTLYTVVFSFMDSTDQVILETEDNYLNDKDMSVNNL